MKFNCHRADSDLFWTLFSFAATPPHVHSNPMAHKQLRAGASMLALSAVWLACMCAPANALQGTPVYEARQLRQAQDVGVFLR